MLLTLKDFATKYITVMMIDLYEMIYQTPKTRFKLFFAELLTVPPHKVTQLSHDCTKQFSDTRHALPLRMFVHLITTPHV